MSSSRNADLVARTVSHLANAAGESSANEWAETLAKDFESLLTASEANEAALLSAIGMARHEKLVALRTRVLNEKGIATLKALEERLKKEMYVSAGSQEPTAADAVLAWYAREVVDFVLEPADRFYEYPSSNRWLEACLAHEAFQKAYKEELVHMEVLDSDQPSRVVRGQLREGGMIDAKPRSTDARRAADKVKTLNAGYKKQQTQRQKEKAATEVTPAVQAALVTEFSLGEKIPSTDPEKIEKCMKMVLTAIKSESLEKVEHPPAMDASNLSEALANKAGIKCKNLFLKCKKPRNETDSGLQLVCCPVDRAVDLKLIQTQLGYKDQLRFAAADVLGKALDVAQGNVTPFALVNDPERLVNVVLDDEMMKNPDTILWFHPLDNTASVGIPAGKLVDFVKASGRVPMVLPLTAAAAAAAGTQQPTTAAPVTPATSAKAQPASGQSKKSGGRGGEGAPVPQKKSAAHPAPIKTSESPQGSPKKSNQASSSLGSPPTTVAEALDREEKALALVQQRAAELEQAKSALEQAKATGKDVENADKQVKAATRAKKEADMIYGNAAGFTEKLRGTGTSGETQGDVLPPTTPLVFTLTHELAQDRLWARLDTLLSAPPKRLEGVQHDAEAQRPVGHSTHNLLVKDSKTKKLYMVCLRQDRQVDLKTLAEKLGAQTLRLAGPADVETAIALTRGCITPLSLYNNSQVSVTPVFDSALMAEPDKKLVICAGCDDPHNHPNHNCVQISVNQMLQLINEAGPREHVVLEL